MTHLISLTLIVLGVCYFAGRGAAAAEPPPLETVDQLPSHPGLPDPLVMRDGKPVADPTAWPARRRELVELFTHYVYGRAPGPIAIEARPLAPEAPLPAAEPAPDGGAAGSVKQIEIRFPELPPDAPRIRLALLLPPPERRPAPVFLALNKCGNHTVHPHPGLVIRPEALLHSECGRRGGEEGRGGERDFWCVEYLLSRGYGLATFHESDIDPDRDDFGDGIHPCFRDLPGPRDSHWGTIAAWAWGLQRAVDYLLSDPDVDPRRICVTGHSRRGKTALWAGATDERIALVVPLQSGTGGCALSRENDQETVERINRVFPHWFNDIFPQFGGREDRLPVDQHLLVALVAPRPLLDVAGLQDKWANYDSALRGLRAASPVWQFLGTEGLVGSGTFGSGAASGADPRDARSGRLAQLRLDTPHTITRDYWQGILDFADRHLPGR